MRKLYLLACLLLTTLHSSLLLAANITWTGGVSGNWSDAAKWSTATVPANGDNVIINSNAIININVASVNISTLTITGNVSVTFSTSTSTEFVISGGANAFMIDNGSTLKNFTNGDVDLHLILQSGTTGVVNGTFILEGSTPISMSVGATVTMASGSLLTVNGTLQLNANAGSVESSVTTLALAAGAFYIHNVDGGIIPLANYNVNSTVKITGSVQNTPAFETPPVYGNLIIDMPNFAPDNLEFLGGYMYLRLAGTVNGDFKILNTNGIPLVILPNGTGLKNLVINKNFEMSANSNIEMSFASFGEEDQDYSIQVNGDFIQNAGVVSLQNNNSVTGTSTLAVKGSIVQNSGTLTANSTAVNISKDLFVVEMNGGVAQTITATSGNTFDNAANMVALRINNTSGGVSLLNPLSVGRIDFQSGVLTTSTTNMLTINNSDNSEIVVNNPTSFSYVAGPVARKTNAAADYIFPTGRNNSYRPVTLTPNTITPSTYIVNYFKAAVPSPTALIAPLGKLNEQEYWSVVRLAGGSDAVLQLALAGAIPSATPASEIVVAGFDGTNWSSLKGTTGTSIMPGNSTVGIAKSEVLNTFNLFTLGIIPNGPLPVILIDFAAKKSGTSAVLNWKIDPVDIPQAFEIWKSADGINFNKIGVVSGIDGITDYTYTDVLTDGNNYYRLRIADKDGSVTFSKIVGISDKENGIALAAMAPTVVVNTAKLTINAASGGQMDIYIVDMTGKVWRKFGISLPAGSSEQQLNFADLSAGVYHIFGYMNGEKTGVIRFVKK